MGLLRWSDNDYQSTTQVENEATSIINLETKIKIDTKTRKGFILVTHTWIGLSAVLITVRITAFLPVLSIILPDAKIISPGTLPSSVSGNLSSEGTAKLNYFINSNPIKHAISTLTHSSTESYVFLHTPKYEFCFSL